MNTVNLLPWRQQWRRHCYVKFIQLILLLFFSVGLVVLTVWFRWQNEAGDWQSQIVQLQRQVVMSDQQVESIKKQKKRLVSLQQKVSAEQQNNVRILGPLLLMISLAPTIDEKMHLISLSMESQRILLEAQTVSSEQIQHLIALLSATHCFSGFKLHAIKHNEDLAYKEHFTLSFDMVEVETGACFERVIDRRSEANESN